MSLDFVRQYWALLIASVLGLALALFIVHRAWSDSTRGRLRAQLKRLRKRYGELVAVTRTLDKASRRLADLQANAAHVKPLRIEQAAEAVEDAQMLQKIAQDQVLIAENHVRKIIVEEFPPSRHEALRRKYLRRPEPDGKPFTF